MPAEKLEQRELLQLNWLCGGLLYLFALWAVSPVDGLGGIPAIICGAAALPFLLRPALSLQLRRGAWNIVALGILALVLVDFLLSGGDLISPLVRMIMLLGLLRCIQIRRRREDMQLVLIALFMVVLGGVLTNSLLFGVQMLLFAPAAMTVLFLIQMCDSGAEGGGRRQLVEDYRPLGLLRRALSTLNWRLLGLWVGLYCCLLGATALIFVLMPRFQLNRALPFLSPPARSSLSGFSDSIEFGEVTEIALDDSVALRADIEGAEGPIANPYWRMAVLDEYHGNGFRQSRSAAEAMRLLRVAEFPLDSRPPSPGAPEIWTLYMEGGVSRYLPIPGSSETIRFQGRQDLNSNLATRALTTPEVPGSVFSYQLRNVRMERGIPATPMDQPLEAGNAADTDTMRSVYPYTTLALPMAQEDQHALERYVEEIQQGRKLDAAEFATATAGWLAEHKRYSLNSTLPPGTNDAIVRWLDSSEPGHCELFAGSFTLLMRAAGFPTRVVTGFSGGVWNGFENYYMVSNSSAHAWAEVFDGRQWLRFDPTPGGETAAGGTMANSFVGVDNTFPAYIDSLRILWYRRVVSFDQQQQVALFSGLRQQLERAKTAVWENFVGIKDRLSELAKTPLSADGLRRLLRNVGIALALWFCVRLLAMRIRKRRLANGPTPRLHPVRRKAGALLLRLDSGPDEGPQSVREELQVLRFGPEESWPQHPKLVLKRARRALRA